PIATNDQFTVLANSANNVRYPIINDFDQDGDSLTIVSNTAPSVGKVSITPDGKAISYTPSVNSYGTDSFSYEITDGRGGYSWANNTIHNVASPGPTVQMVSPTFGGDVYTTNAGANVTIVAYVDPSAFVTNVDFFLGMTKIGSTTNGINGLYSINWLAL